MLLSLQNLRQRQESDCLAACTAMVLDHLGIRIDYYRLLRLLNTGEPGTPFFNITRVSSLGVFVQAGQHQDDFLLFEQYIDVGLPVIVAIETGVLDHWHGVETDHAMVVVGFSEAVIFVNDPFFNEAPIAIPSLNFFTAWSDRDFQYAVIGLTDPNLSMQ